MLLPMTHNQIRRALAGLSAIEQADDGFSSFGLRLVYQGLQQLRLHVFDDVHHFS